MKGKWRGRNYFSFHCFTIVHHFIIVVSLLIAVNLRYAHGACSACSYLKLTERERLKKPLRIFEITNLRKITKLAHIIPLDFLYGCKQG